MTFTYTTQRQVRNAFWQSFPQFHKRVSYYGQGFYRDTQQNEYPADVRCAFVEWIDGLQKSGQISSQLADKVTL